ncbi:hypothetical protein HMPREF0602_1845 [Neisseria meningitidis ATCC 13091]|uniref:Uncharacterized protein n=1 Tax=Neisseria meningitidis serogroup B (strain ATCC 13091 / M2091) TaxID=862513 RepID=E0NBG3_NEIM3|nr:hypothetical protein HMPREF0602_1845 [Neisseria meningitidis ATCC 13091]
MSVLQNFYKYHQTMKMPSEPAIWGSDGIFPYIHTIRRSARLSGFC